MLDYAVETLVYSVLGLDAGSGLGQAVNFFVYDSVKIIILLYAMVFGIGVFRTYIPNSKIKKALTGGQMGLGYFAASFFGAVTPFCSCSSIPIFMGFLKAGIPLGVAFTFLVTSPLINEYLIVLMLSYFGVKVTATYVVFGVLLGVSAGVLINHLRLEKHIEKGFRGAANHKDVIYRSFVDRVSFGFSEANDIVLRLWKWVLLGVGAGAAIHGFVPEELIHSVLERTGLLSVPLAVVLGMPIYANCAAVVPIAVVLFQKGVPLGTALSFMMSTAALSLPEAIILRR
ncbi:MAG: permease, partial [Candidatus Altiarchaeota archaeon]|nr:permease [Candidatus Altiarchaeota archaeon]